MSSQYAFSEDSDDDNDNVSANPEVKQFIYDQNSLDGCVKYHDIYVRAVPVDENLKLFIFMKNYEGE